MRIGDPRIVWPIILAVLAPLSAAGGQPPAAVVLYPALNQSERDLLLVFPGSPLVKSFL
jgi:hypothetical protein